jgi:cytochrome P450
VARAHSHSRQAIARRCYLRVIRPAYGDPVLTQVQLDPLSPEFLADPHPVFDRLRGAGDLVRDPRGWSAISYASCSAAFLDEALVPGIDPMLVALGYEPLWGVQDRTLTDSEGETHARLRRFVGPWFTARRIDRLRSYTRELVAERLAAVGPEPFDVVDGLTNPVPAHLFCALAGVDAKDADLLAEWSRALLLVFTTSDEMVAPVRRAKSELAAYTHELLAHKRRHPGDDLATQLAERSSAGELDEQDAYYLLEELLAASVDNTANTAGMAILTLLQHPDAWAALHDDPDRLTSAVEECGRYQPAIRHTIKYAVADTEIGDAPVRAGEFVTLRIAAAHRDPAVYASPHVFDSERVPERPQLAFGAGRHYCLGAALGRMEVQEMVGGLTSRWRSARQADGADLAVHHSGHAFRLPVVLGGAA